MDLELKRKYFEERWPETMMHGLGIELTELTLTRLTARMPVDKRTRQPYGLLHGGANVVLAETLASMGAALQVDHKTHKVVGIEINANHLRSVSDGWVYGEAKPIHIGRSTQVWSIEIKTEDGKLSSVSRCTIAVVPI